MVEAPMRSNKRPVVPVLAALLLLVVFALALAGANADAFWLDEIWSVRYAFAEAGQPMPLERIWNTLAVSDPWQAPLYYMALAGWGRLAGSSELAVRALSIWFGLLALAITIRLGQWLGRDLGIVAAVLLASSAYFVYFFHEARPYTLTACTAALSLLAYWRCVSSARPRLIDYGLLALFATAALYSHYFNGVWLLAIGVMHLLAWRRLGLRRWFWVPVALACALVAFLPWFQVVLRGIAEASLQFEARAASGLAADTALSRLAMLFSNGQVALLLVLLATGSRAYRARAWWHLVILLTVTLCVILVANIRLGFLLEVRYLLLVWMPLAAVCAFGVLSLRRRAPGLAALILMAWAFSGLVANAEAFTGDTLHHRHWHQPWRLLRSALAEAGLAEGDGLAYMLPDDTWPVYHRDGVAFYLSQPAGPRLLIDQPAKIGVEAYDGQAQNALAAGPRLFTAVDTTRPNNHADDFHRALLRFGALECGPVAPVEGLQIALYIPSHQPDVREQISFASPEGLGVDVVQWGQHRDQASVTLLMRASQPEMLGVVSMGLHLEDANGALVRQVDFGVPIADQGCIHRAVALDGLPLGDYVLNLVAYNWETGARLPAEAGPTASLGYALVDGRWRLGPVTVN